MELGDILEM
jgi:hypothetical protein